MRARRINFAARQNFCPRNRAILPGQRPYTWKGSITHDHQRRRMRTATGLPRRWTRPLYCASTAGVNPKLSRQQRPGFTLHAPRTPPVALRVHVGHRSPDPAAGLTFFCSGKQTCHQPTLQPNSNVNFATSPTGRPDHVEGQAFNPGPYSVGKRRRICLATHTARADRQDERDTHVQLRQLGPERRAPAKHTVSHGHGRIRLTPATFKRPPMSPRRVSSQGAFFSDTPAIGRLISGELWRTHRARFYASRGNGSPLRMAKPRPPNNSAKTPPVVCFNPLRNFRVRTPFAP